VASAKLGALAMTFLLVMYLVLVGERSLVLVQSMEPLGVAIGSLMLFLPALALWGIYMELRFGLRIEKLGKRLKQEGAWPNFPFELRPSGRPTKESATKVFDVYKELVQSDEDNWRNWFILGLAYDAAGDRPRARQAMGRAIKLFSE
jgi:hypothetical protein